MRELNPEGASILIRDVLDDGTRGSLSFTKHARKQMVLRGYRLRTSSIFSKPVRSGELN